MVIRRKDQFVTCSDDSKSVSMTTPAEARKRLPKAFRKPDIESLSLETFIAL